MKLKMFALILLAGVRIGTAQEAVSAEDMQKAIALLTSASAGLEGLALKPELDTAHAQGFKAEGVGVIIIPDKHLGSDKKAMKEEGKKAGKGGAIPAGELWLMGLAPKKDGSVVTNDKLRLVKVTAKDKEQELVMFRLGITKSGKKELSLALYGKGTEPVMSLPLTIETGTGNATSISGRREGEDSGVVTLILAGKFKAELPVGKPAN